MALEDRVSMLDQMVLEDDQPVIEGLSAGLYYIAESQTDYADIATFKTKWIEEAPFLRQMVRLISLFILLLLFILHDWFQNNSNNTDLIFPFLFHNPFSFSPLVRTKHLTASSSLLLILFLLECRVFFFSCSLRAATNVDRRQRIHAYALHLPIVRKAVSSAEDSRGSHEGNHLPTKHGGS